MLEKIRLLITCVGGTTAPVLLDCLHKSSIFSYSLVGVDSDSPGSSKPFLESYYQVPKGSDEKYIEKILDIVRQEKIDFIMPGSDEEAITISKNKKELTDVGVIPIVSNIDVLDLIRNKYKKYKKLEENGIRVPEYKLVNSTEELKNAIDAFGYPEVTVISKPTDGRGGRGLYVFEGNDNPPAWLGEGQREKRISKQDMTDDLLSKVIQGESLVMPALSAPAYDADVVAVKGVTKLAVVRERVNPAGIPFTGNKIHADKLITKYCNDIAMTLDLDAIHDIDLMTNKNGEPCVIEVNPRPSGSMAASLIAGIPVIDIAILAIQGKSIPDIQLETDIMVLPSDDGGMKIEYKDCDL